MMLLDATTIPVVSKK